MSTANERVYYAVGRGKETGIFSSWKECKALIDGFSNAKYRKFYSLEDAKEFVNFWKNYSTPVKDSNESTDSVSSDLNQGEFVTSAEESMRDKMMPAKFKLGDEELGKKNTSLIVCSGKLPVLAKTESKLSSEENVAEEEQSHVGLSVESSESSKNEASGSQSITLGSYSNEFNVSKLFKTSTQIKKRGSDYGEAKEDYDKITVCLNMLESVFGETAVQIAAERKMLENKKKGGKVCTGTNITINLQEPDGSVEKVSEIQVNDQPAEVQPATQKEALQQSPSDVSSTHLPQELKKGSTAVNILALNLRLDSFEKRFDNCWKEIGGLASDITNLKSDIKELKRAISSQSSNLSPCKSGDGLKQTTLMFSPSSSARSEGEFGEPQSKRGRTLKRKLSGRGGASDDDFENLLSSLKAEKVDFSTFTVDEDDFVRVYTDGSSLSNGTEGAKAGIGIWFGDGHPLNVAEPVAGPPTNIIAEIQAARVAIQLAMRAGIKKLRIYTDSEFLVNCATKWINNWKKNGWTLSSGGPVKNRKELEKLDLYASKITVQWEKVPAHSKIKGNETADRLANEGASRYER